MQLVERRVTVADVRRQVRGNIKERPLVLRVKLMGPKCGATKIIPHQDNLGSRSSLGWNPVEAEQPRKGFVRGLGSHGSILAGPKSRFQCSKGGRNRLALGARSCAPNASVVGRYNGVAPEPDQAAGSALLN